MQKCQRIYCYLPQTGPLSQFFVPVQLAVDPYGKLRASQRNSKINHAYNTHQQIVGTLASRVLVFYNIDEKAQPSHKKLSNKKLSFALELQSRFLLEKRTEPYEWYGEASIAEENLV